MLVPPSSPACLLSCSVLSGRLTHVITSIVYSCSRCFAVCRIISYRRHRPHQPHQYIYAFTPTSPLTTLADIAHAELAPNPLASPVLLQSLDCAAAAPIPDADTKPPLLFTGSCFISRLTSLLYDSTHVMERHSMIIITLAYASAGLVLAIRMLAGL